MIRSTTSGAVLGAAVAVMVLAGCSSGSAPARTSSATRASSAGSAAASTSPGARPADAATTSAVATAYARFFDSATSPVDSQKFLQNGSAFGAVLEKQAQGSQAQHATAKVTSVLVTNPDLVTVRFTVSSNGTALLPDIAGFGVRVQGTWLVAATTFCRLLTLQGQAPSVCKDPSIVALPR